MEFCSWKFTVGRGWLIIGHLLHHKYNISAHTSSCIFLSWKWSHFIMLKFWITEKLNRGTVLNGTRDRGECEGLWMQMKANRSGEQEAHKGGFSLFSLSPGYNFDKVNATISRIPADSLTHKRCPLFYHTILHLLLEVTHHNCSLNQQKAESDNTLLAHGRAAWLNLDQIFWFCVW